VLADGPRSVQKIADALPISRPAVSRHLRVLADAGLVASTADGTRRVYELRRDGVDAIRSFFVSVWADAAPRFRLLAENRPEPPATGA
jgi:DNA-binding transcriptional ArsR family regulator